MSSTVDKKYPPLQELIYVEGLVKPFEAWEFTLFVPVNPWIDIKEKEN
jgi:hypothetical protein